MRTALLLLAALAGCDSRCPPAENGMSSCSAEPTQHMPFVPNSFSLFVSNQSFELSPVDMYIQVDNQLAVSGDFEVGSQHTWLRFELGLSPGQHRLRVTTHDLADVVLDQPFEMDDRKYGIVSFWYYPTGSPEPTPPQFQLNVQDEEPAFD